MKINFYRTRENNPLPSFSHEDTPVFCHEIRRILKKLNFPEYFPEDWRLFIDTPRLGLECVLLHNKNKYDSIPIAHSTKMKEEYNTIALALEKIKYHEHQWVVYVHL